MTGRVICRCFSCEEKRKVIEFCAKIAENYPTYELNESCSVGHAIAAKIRQLAEPFHMENIR
jgi:hypothetical protein